MENLRRSDPLVKPERSLFLSLACVLLGFGVLMVHSASITSRPTEFEQIYLSRHAIHLAVGVFVASLCSLVPAKFWKQSAPWLFAATLVLIVLVLIPGIGTRVNGAQRWLRFGPLQMQPSELAKLTLPLLLGAMVVKRQTQLHRWLAGTIPFVLPIAVTLPLVLKQPDLGTAVFLAMSSGLLLFLAGWPIRNFVLGLVPAGGMALTLKPYQWQRISDFLATWSDIDRASYHVKQSLLSLGSGGLMGVGLGKGWQKLSFLPEANTDFVFAVVGEELGLVGSLGLVLLWAGFFVTGLELFRHRDRRGFEFLVGVTLLSQMVLQAAINVAVVTSMLPTKGISHPLLSYGGSNLVINLVAIGIVVSLSKSTSAAEDIPSRESLAEHRLS
ncbi:MAG TPA: putative peptidoglycan glycosyltransferase FtsW, partial [Planctomycetaceae bacterium]|nr:putative peptidoglycan glycosyltransferase FtsW [Planctomycetaceae bacterium]